MKSHWVYKILALLPPIFELLPMPTFGIELSLLNYVTDESDFNTQLAETHDLSFVPLKQSLVR